MFLARYKLMYGSDCKMVYNTKDYHRKRLKVLEQEKYIRRVNRLYIKLDVKGTKMVKDFGYDYSFNCRKKEYIDRLNEIAKVAALTINSNIEFVASWDLKDSNIYTQTSRKYLGKIKYQNKESLVYYISKEKQISYISQTINDIQKIMNYKNILIFIENMNIFNGKQRFVFGKDSTLLINPTKFNLNLLKKLEKVDFYEIVKKIYSNKEILLSNWIKAEYMTNNREYIVVMPFIDTEKLNKLGMFYKNNPNVNRKIDIITLKENKEKICEILTNKVNIIELDNWLGGIIDGKREEN